MHPEFAPIAIISAVSLLLPLPWHWRARNVATLCIIGWLFIANIIYAVDALIWPNTVEIFVPVWCDITTKLVIGANFALPAACLCISIHLEQVASVRRAKTTVSDKRRRNLFELAMCIGLPILFMALHYVVQGHRFDIIEGYGCRPTTYFSIPSIFIVWAPPILLSIASIIYSGLALRHFMVRRLSFAAHLHASSSGLTTSRYLRLMSMAGVQMIWSITVTCYDLWFTVIAVPIRTWDNWADVHSDFLRIDLYPDAFTPPFVKRAFYVIWWLVPISTFLFVAFFAFGKDAMDEYKKCLKWFRTHILRHDANPKGSKKLGGIPMFRSKSPRALQISKPISQSTDTSKSSESTLPPYSPSGASFSSFKKSLNAVDYDDSDAHSEVTQYEETFYKGPKAIGSYSDLSLRTPSTAFTANSFQIPEPVPKLPPGSPSPLTPPPSHYRLRTLNLQQPPSPSSRPLTYPSFGATPPDSQPSNPSP